MKLNNRIMYACIQYIPRNMHTVFALLCFVVVIHWLIFPYPSGLLHWHCGNLTIASVPAKQPWWIWINTSYEFIMNDCITTTKQSTTKPCHISWDVLYIYEASWEITLIAKRFPGAGQFKVLQHYVILYMRTSSNGNIFRVTGPLCGEFTGPGEFPTQRPVTQSFDVFFDLRLNKRLGKQPSGWWFEPPSCSLWRHRNGRHNTYWSSRRSTESSCSSGQWIFLIIRANESFYIYLRYACTGLRLDGNHIWWFHFR